MSIPLLLYYLDISNIPFQIVLIVRIIIAYKTGSDIQAVTKIGKFLVMFL